MTTLTLNAAPIVRTLACIAVAALLLLVMGAQARDTGTQPDGASAVVTQPAARTASEQQWNDREDRKAGKNVGLPGIY